MSGDGHNLDALLEAICRLDARLDVWSESVLSEREDLINELAARTESEDLGSERHLASLLELAARTETLRTRVVTHRNELQQEMAQALAEPLEQLETLRKFAPSSDDTASALDHLA